MCKVVSSSQHFARIDHLAMLLCYAHNPALHCGTSALGVDLAEPERRALIVTLERAQGKLIDAAECDAIRNGAFGELIDGLSLGGLR